MKFKTGDCVKLVLPRSNSFDGPDDPIWGGKCGKVSGMVTSADGDDCSTVKWGNGITHQYKNFRLRKLSNNKFTLAMEKAVDYIMPYRNWIVLVAVLAFMDFFVFKGAYTSKIKEIIQRVADKIFNMCECAINKICHIETKKEGQ